MDQSDSQRHTRPNYWELQDAQARLGELIRRVHSDGPQHVTVHGHDEVVVIAAEEYRRLKDERTGMALVEAMQAMTHRERELEAQSGLTYP